ncbi:MAG: 4-oxalomesaconate tautomerase [Rhodospirillales bacterium]|nr:4-oxalomesaconate tautomerase [Rhodospirillales bacterium]MBT8002354.1 4-oxalomesaconate tautomerase [Rhodospirillales bacterium]
MQTAIPCVLMRGGTSKGPYFHASDLPADRDGIARVLMAAMGSPDARQIDGIGGADFVTSKVAIVSPSDRDDADVNYLFAQVQIEDDFVDFNPPCGNILSGIGPFAIETGLVKAQDGKTLVRIYHENISALIESVVDTPGGQVNYVGDTAIDGVPGTSAPIVLNWLNIVGSKTGKMLPTGNVVDVIDGVSITCVDVAMPMVLMKAEDLGVSGNESKEELEANDALFAKMEPIRLKASEMMGLGDARGKVIPKIGIMSAPRNGGTITSRYFTPKTCHSAHAGTGALCVSTACVVPGSVANQVANIGDGPVYPVVIEHPTGQIEVQLETEGTGTDIKPVKGGLIRTARWLFEGKVFIPASVWEGHQKATNPKAA